MTVPNVVQAILENLAAAVPVKIVRSYQQGVRFTFGRDTARLDAGVHWFFPFLQAIELVDVVPQVVNLPTQSLVTADDIAVSVSGAIEYQIEDARKMFTSIQDLDKSLVNTGMGYIARLVEGSQYDNLRGGAPELAASVCEEMNEHVGRWGVEVNQVYVTDLVRAHQLRVFGDVNPGLRTT